ncbi:MAG: NERD domain-containing protein [Bacillota bacterium]|nr:NERD domain-containing protein [Bacillota bacterium]
MGLFDKIKDTVFYKDSSEAERHLEELLRFRESAPPALQTEMDRELRLLEAGVFGEKQVRFELRNSHIPMLVLQDLRFEFDGRTAQIDYLILTRKLNYVVECKHLYGDIEITQNGDFVRTMQFGNEKKREGLYSPITQNRRHLELIRAMRSAEKNLLMRALFEKFFYHRYRSVVVLSNPKTILNARYAPKEVRDQVIRADQLAEFIRKLDASIPKDETKSESDMLELAKYFRSKHKPQYLDITAPYRKRLEELPNSAEMPVEAPVVQVLCPKCGAKMIRRRATKGERAGKEFFGCSRYPHCRGIVNVE